MKTEVIPFVAMVVIAPAELGGRMELVKSGPRRLAEGAGVDRDRVVRAGLLAAAEPANLCFCPVAHA